MAMGNADKSTVTSLPALAAAWDAAHANRPGLSTNDMPRGLRALFANFGLSDSDGRDRPQGDLTSIEDCPLDLHRLRLQGHRLVLEGTFNQPYGLMMLWFLRGRADYISSGRTRRISTGDVAVVRSWQRLELDLHEECETIAIFLPLSWLGGEAATLASVGWAASVELMPASFIFRDVVDGAFEAFLKSLSTPHLVKHTAEMMRLVFNKGFGAITSLDSFLFHAKSVRMNQIFNEALAHMRDEHLSPAKVAAKLKISVRTLYQECADHGTTFSFMLNSLRLQLAGYRLKTTDARISDIAYASGFGSVPYFCRQFKRMYGVSPKAYRAMF